MREATSSAGARLYDGRPPEPRRLSNFKEANT